MGKAQNTAGLSGTSTASQDLYVDLKAQEEAKGRSWRPWHQYSFYAKSDCTLKINNDADFVQVFADVPLSGQGQIISFVVVEAGIEFGFVVEY